MPPKGDLQLSIGYWIVSHKSVWRKTWSFALLSFTLFSSVWTTWFIIQYLNDQPRQDRATVQLAARLAAFAPAKLGIPTELVASTPVVIRRDNKFVDIVARLDNRNADWAAVLVRYHFIIDGRAQQAVESFVNQSTNRPVMQFNVQSETSAPNAELIIDNIDWARSSEAVLPAGNFTVEKSELIPATASIAGRTVETVGLTATVVNKSVYNFYQVTIPIIVKAGERIVAIDEVVVNRWPTLTPQTIRRSWPFSVVGATSVDLDPQINRFDRDNVYR